MKGKAGKSVPECNEVCVSWGEPKGHIGQEKIPYKEINNNTRNKYYIYIDGFIRDWKEVGSSGISTDSYVSYSFAKIKLQSRTPK